MTTESCASNLNDCDLQAAYQTARAKLSPTLDPDERVKIWQEIWALSGELGRRYPLSTETLSA
jgi:hypothetical protein